MEIVKWIWIFQVIINMDSTKVTFEMWSKDGMTFSNRWTFFSEGFPLFFFLFSIEQIFFLSSYFIFDRYYRIRYWLCAQFHMIEEISSNNCLDWCTNTSNNLQSWMPIISKSLETKNGLIAFAFALEKWYALAPISVICHEPIKRWKNRRLKISWMAYSNNYYYLSSVKFTLLSRHKCAVLEKQKQKRKKKFKT